MPIIHAEGFLEPPCLTLPGEPLVLQERVEGGGTDNEPITLNLLPLVPEFINTEFHIYSFCTFKIFVRSRRDQEKKYRIGIRQQVYLFYKWMYLRYSRVAIERLTAKAKVARVLGSIPASSDTVESEARQMKQC